MKKIRVENDELNAYSEYRLDKMWNDGEVAKCSKCKIFYKQEKKIFLYNMGLCDKCKMKQKEYDQTLKIMKSWE
jgi:hypothetical protein